MALAGLLRRLFGRLRGRSAAGRRRHAPVVVQFDDQGFSTLNEDGERSGIRWQDVALITIAVEDALLPFPYWYVGGKDCLLRIPNDAPGARELFFEAFPAKIPGYDCDATYGTILVASAALEGSFVVWQATAAGRDRE